MVNQKNGKGFVTEKNLHAKLTKLLTQLYQDFTNLLRNLAKYIEK